MTCTLPGLSRGAGPSGVLKSDIIAMHASIILVGTEDDLQQNTDTNLELERLKLPTINQKQAVEVNRLSRDTAKEEKVVPTDEVLDSPDHIPDSVH